MFRLWKWNIFVQNLPKMFIRTIWIWEKNEKSQFFYSDLGWHLNLQSWSGCIFVFSLTLDILTTYILQGSDILVLYNKRICPLYDTFKYNNMSLQRQQKKYKPYIVLQIYNWFWKDLKMDRFTLVLICYMYALLWGFKSIRPYAWMYNVEMGRASFFLYFFHY